LSAPAESNSLAWYAVPGWPATEATYTLPYSWHGGGQYLGAPTRLFLLSGWNPSGTGSGHLLLLKLVAAPSKQITSPVAPVNLGPGIDPCDVAWNAQDNYLYVLDCKGKRLLVAPWQGGETALPTSFVTAFDSTSMPELAVPETLVLAVKQGESGVRIQEHEDFRAAVEKTPRVYYDGTSWAVEMKEAAYEVDTYRVEDSLYTNSRGPLLLLSSVAGEAAIIEFETGQIATTITLPASPTPTWVNWGNPNLLIPGLRYKILWPDQSESNSFRPMVRYGKPQNAGLLAITPGFANPRRACVGSVKLGIGAGVRISPVPSGSFSEAIQVYLLVAARPASGVDPVIVNGDVAILQAANVFGPYNFTLNEDKLDVDSTIIQPVPNDPTLAGAVILWQWVAYDSNLIASFTDVFGTTIFNNETGGQQAASARSAWSQPSTKSKPARPKKSVVESAWRWLRSPNGVVPREKLRTMLYVTRGMLATMVRKKR